VLLAVLALVPLLAMLALAFWRRRVRPPPPAARIEASAERLDALVYALVPPGTPAARRALVGALRAAGVERKAAERLVSLHLALEADRFGTEPDSGIAAQLGREIDSALETVPRKLRRAAGIAALCLLALIPRRAAAQSGLELYARGDYAAAARAFRAEAETSPPRAGRFYDLAAAEYLSHQDADAVAALLAARAAAPRDRYVRALWTALAREHEQLRRAGRVFPLSAEECFALALLALWLAAGLYLALRRFPVAWGGALGLAAALGTAGVVLRAQRQEPRGVLAAGVSLRTSPHGLAPERGAVAAFSVVELERRLGAWWLVRTRDGAEGWVPAGILARSPALD
jgi:hypothetical protein